MNVKHILSHKVVVLLLLILTLTFALSVWQWNQIRNYQLEQIRQESLIKETQEILSQVSTELDQLKNSDPHKTNIDLQTRIGMIESTYQGLLDLYEEIDDFANSNYTAQQVADLKIQYANLLDLTSKREYEEVVTAFAILEKAIADYQQEKAQQLLAEAQAEAAKLAAEQVAQQQAGIDSPSDSQTATTSNSPPTSGYSRQVVASDVGSFTVSIVAGDLSSTRVIVDTASSSDCTNDCPILSLGDYVGRNGAYAGINGSYFCPASYPSCAGKTNTFDLLVMNKDKVYFNSENNVYSNNPGVIFGSGYIRFVGAVSQWGRDTSIDSMLSNYPLLVSGGNVVFGGDDDPKKGSKGNRSFVANKGNIVYIGVVHSATVAESARVMKAMEMENALNLDDGGSTALWFGGYKVGPGRNLPNVILFTHR